MIVSINQPAYLPWLGYFDRIASSDLHIVLDHVQFEKNSFINRNRLRTKDGDTWLTIPLATKGRFGSLPINKLEFAQNVPWSRKHWSTIDMLYRNAPYFNSYASVYKDLYACEWTDFISAIKSFLKQYLSDLGINTPIVFSSELNITGCKSELILNLCRSVGAKKYISGPQGRNYIDESSFSELNINIEYQDYKHPRYVQCYPGFQPFMGILDLLFNHGCQSLSILKNTYTLPS